MEQVRSILGASITVTSGYRNPKVNAAVVVLGAAVLGALLGL